MHIADASRGEVAAIATREQRELIVEIEQVVVDRRGSEQDQLLASAVASAAAVEANEALQVLVALGIAVAEVVRLIDQDHISVTAVFDGEVELAQLFLRHDNRRDRRVLQLLLPHIAQ